MSQIHPLIFILSIGVDRIDIQVEVPTLCYQELASKDAGELSAVIRERVNAARALQRWG